MFLYGSFFLFFTIIYMDVEFDLLYITGFSIKRVWYDWEWWYNITDVIFYLTKSKDPIRYVFKLRSYYNVYLYESWDWIVCKLKVKTDKWIRYANCTNFEWLKCVFRALPRKYRYRVKNLKRLIVENFSLYID